MHELDPQKLPRHVAIIMDGNGRWARARMRNRVFGHDEGARSVRDVVRTCRELEISYLTLYAFSKENWQRPEAEVKALWNLLKRFLRSELPELVEKDVRLLHLGDTEDIPHDVRREFQAAVDQTAGLDKLVLSLAVNYGGRQEIARAAALFAKDVAAGLHKPEDLSPELFSRYLFTKELPDPDLVIRTGGEYRVSNFLLWQLAYAELYITETLWPDFRRDQFLEALYDFQKRERRFGKTSDQVQDTKSCRAL